MPPEVEGYADETHISFPMGDPYPYEPMKGYRFHPLNKPFAISQWLFNTTSGRSLGDNHELIIMDCDALPVRPIDVGISQLGKPVASASYFLGHEYLFSANSQVRKFCGSSCDSITKAEVDESYNVGPPYYIRAGDLRRIVPHWYDRTLQMMLAGDSGVYMSHPGGWLADMYGYVIGSIREKLPHQCRWDLMTQHSLGDARKVGQATPQWFHYTQRYNLTKARRFRNHYMFFNKHEWHKENLLDCASLLEDTEFFFRRKHPYNPPPEVLTAAPPAVIPNANDNEDAVWFFWHLRHHFLETLADWRDRHCNKG